MDQSARLESSHHYKRLGKEWGSALWLPFWLPVGVPVAVHVDDQRSPPAATAAAECMHAMCQIFYALVERVLRNSVEETCRNGPKLHVLFES